MRLRQKGPNRVRINWLVEEADIRLKLLLKRTNEHPPLHELVQELYGVVEELARSAASAADRCDRRARSGKVQPGPSSSAVSRMKKLPPRKSDKLKGSVRTVGSGNTRKPGSHQSPG